MTPQGVCDGSNPRTPKNELRHTPAGIPKGEVAEMLDRVTALSTSLLGRLKSPRNMRKFLGDSLHTFSSVRKYAPGGTLTILYYLFTILYSLTAAVSRFSSLVNSE